MALDRPRYTSPPGFREQPSGGSTSFTSVELSLSSLDAKTKSFVTCTTAITRPSDTNVYALGDALADSTATPTTGGFTLTSAARESAGSGLIRDVVVIGSVLADVALQGELWLFDSAVTAVNDNAAFALSDADAAKLVGIVPFWLAKSGGNNAVDHVRGLDLAFTAVGSANLRFLVKVNNVYTPTSAEVLTVRAKIEHMS